MKRIPSLQPHPQSSTTTYLLLVLLSTVLPNCCVYSSFGPFRGCEELYSYGAPTGNDCYAVDSYFCNFEYKTGCKQITGSYLYYVGGERRDGGQTYREELYETVTLSVSADCSGNGASGSSGARSCEVEGGPTGGVQTCTCTNNDANDWKRITLTNCGAPAGGGSAVFGTTPQTITIAPPEDGGGHFAIAYNATRCQHDAITQRKQFPVSIQMNYTMPDSGSQRQNIGELLASTHKWYNRFLQTRFGLFQTFQLGTWTSKHFPAKMVLDYQATITLDPADASTTLEMLRTAMVSTQTMTWYRNSAVKPTKLNNGNRPFSTVTLTTGTINPR